MQHQPLFEQLQTLLYQSTTLVDNKLRKLAEADLIRVSLEHQESFGLFLQMSITNQDSNRGASAASFLSSLLQKKLTRQPAYDQQFQLQDLTNLLLVLQNPQVNTLTKSLLAKTVTAFLTEGNQHLINYAFNCMMEALQSNDYNQVSFGFLIWVSYVQSLDLYRLSNGSRPQTDWIAGYSLKGVQLLTILTELLKGEHHEGMLVNKPIIDLIRLMNEWAFGAQELIQKICKFKGFPKEYLIGIQNSLIFNKEFCLALFQVILLNISVRGQAKSNLVISTIGEPEIDRLLNLTKNYAIHTYNQILNILFSERAKAECKTSPFFEVLHQLLPFVIVSIDTYAQSPSIDFLEAIRQSLYNQICRATDIQDLVTNMLQFIVHCGNQSDFYVLLSDSKLQILFDIIFPLLTSSKEEHLKLVDEPQEFVTLALDTIDKQMSQIPKTAAAQLLEMFCDHIDGSTTFIAQIAIHIILREVRAIEGTNSAQDPVMQQFMLKLSDKYFFVKVDVVHRIDACLVTLTILSYLLSKRADILASMESMLSECSAYFQSPNLDGLLRARLALFLGYYCDNLFKTPVAKSKLVEYIQYLINQLCPINQNWHLAVKYQAVDALKNIFEDEDLMLDLKPLIPQVFTIFVQSLGDSDYELHFEFIASLFKFYAFEIVQAPAAFLTAIRTIVSKIQAELQRVEQGDKDRQLCVDKCMHILRVITETDTYRHANLLVEFENQLLPLYQGIEQQTKPYEEDVFLLMGTLIQRTGSLSLPQQQMLQLFPKIVERQCHRFGPLFELLNLYLQKGTDLFRTVETQSFVVKLCLDIMNKNQNGCSPIDQGEGALILQMLIQCLKESLDTQVLTTIFQGVLATSQTEIKAIFLKSRLMGVFLSSLFVDPDRSFFILNQLGVQEQIIQQLITQHRYYQPGYDIKLFIITMSKLLQRESRLFNPAVISHMIHLLTKQKLFEEKEQHKRDLDSSEEDISEDPHFDEDDQEAKLAFDFFKSELIEHDEFEYFKGMIHYYKETQNDKIQMLKNYLNPAEIETLLQLISYSRVLSSEGQMVPRKVISVGKRKIVAS